MAQKKSLLYIVLITILCAAFLSACSHVQASDSVPEHLTLTWTENPQTTQTITWKTEPTAVAGQVEYEEAASADSFPEHAGKVAASVNNLTTNLGVISIHTATLTNLKPGTRYLYRVGDGTNWSERHTFVTASVNIPHFQFLIFGDSQSVNYNTWRTTLHNAYQGNPDAAFIINMGDLVDVGQDYAQWNRWFSATAGVIDTVPIMPVSGNHETYSPTGKLSMPVLFTAQFKLPDNGPAGLQGQAYSFDYGDVHFSVLDSQAGEEERFLPSMLEIQRDWLELDLTASTKKWRIVLLHRPVYNNKEINDNDSIRTTFAPLFDKYHVDVVFTAHDHVYARTYPLYSGEAVDNPAKGTIYVATGRSGTKTYNDTLAMNWDLVFYNPLDQPNYIMVDMAGDRFTVRAFKQDGTMIDEWSVHKVHGKL
jgi:hypothetical protein